ncbi:MAG TPA: hypothetical protein VGR22_07240 [Thermomicrobiales bacterium]|nr:hypothetical protein [Thermomicrobiales bacterium]
MTVERLPDLVRELVERYLNRLRLPADQLMITADRREFERWLGRRMSSSLGGAYIFLRHHDRHAILINLSRIDLDQPRALEVVVAEELVHMRDWIDGERRRHAKHGYDRIAYRVAELTGASLEEVRSALLPLQRRPYRYVYACPRCGMRVKRRRRGRWSCGRCAPRFDGRFELRIIEELE